MKTKLLDFCAASDEVFFAGRLILVGRLKKPLDYSGLKIEGIELLAPKENNKFKDGLEHAEFVTKLPLPEFLEKHKNIDFKLDAYAREINPELIVKFSDCAAKFHAQSLLEVRGIK